jgi:hypothetical protein
MSIAGNIVATYFLISSACLHILIGKLRPFTFSVIINSYLLIPLILLGFFFLLADSITFYSFLSPLYILRGYWFLKLNIFSSFLILMGSSIPLMKLIPP